MEGLFYQYCNHKDILFFVSFSGELRGDSNLQSSQSTSLLQTFLTLSLTNTSHAACQENMKTLSLSSHLLHILYSWSQLQLIRKQQVPSSVRKQVGRLVISRQIGREETDKDMFTPCLQTSLRHVVRHVYTMFEGLHHT